MNSRNKIKILIVGNDKKLLKILSDLLNNEQFFIKKVKKGIISLKEALTNKYQIILIAIGNTKGEKFLKGLESLKANSYNTPTILISHQLTAEEEIAVYQAGIHIIHKEPINPQLLLVQIDKLLNENFVKIEIQTGDILLQPRQRRIFRRGKEIHLTCTEYDFLLLLIKYNGAVLNRDQIIDNILKYTRDVNPCAVDTMVSRIRKKLGKNKKEVIETVQGVGYRLANSYIEDIKTLYK